MKRNRVCMFSGAALLLAGCASAANGDEDGDGEQFEMDEDPSGGMGGLVSVPGKPVAQPPFTMTDAGEPKPTPNNPPVMPVVDAGPDPKPEVPAHGPPEVTAVSPLEGPWGTTVVIEGSDLGSARRSGVTLFIGDDLVLQPKADEVLSWTEELVSFRVPFPHWGNLQIKTPEGAVELGAFAQPYTLSPAAPVPVGTSVLGSISNAVGHLALALDTDPIRIVQFDGASWQSGVLPIQDILPETVRLYVAEGMLKAFALSSDVVPVIVDFSFDGVEWLSEVSSVETTLEYALAGGPNGAVVWFSQADGWWRARPGTSGWSVDKGPILDPAPGDSLRTAGATSDGALYFSRPKDTGNFFDDLEAPFISQLPSAANKFNSEFKVGLSADDYLTDLKLVDRGRGLLVEYCGSDKDPFGLTGREYKCFTSALTSAGFSLLSSSREVEFRSYHAATTNKWVVGTCDRDAGSVLTEDEDPIIAVHLTWPCGEFGGVEIDPEGNAVAAIRYDSGFVVLLPP